ncbi:50S ribosomal protein L9 [Raphidocelis subcapitata]|uniref:Large ribosomal subunit protein bL9c n=1 Tax=Raphidocelis subcapitata TaxID=307507 RepID=A0A2V0PGJ2_9CHLO|nr:50S ribosomal protein L9 [Raphidocelis subcapitata]|eukprot:GBF96185.1 50S ribosomal protein L9 [Raphidocelis subcapitata]
MALASSSGALRGLSKAPQQLSRPVSRTRLVVEANKRVQKKQRVILTKDIENVGKEGELLTVPVGYLRNYLLPNGIARIASAGILEGWRRRARGGSGQESAAEGPAALLAERHGQQQQQQQLQIRKRKEDALRAKLEEKAQAQAFANALATIGKFIIKKKAGDKDALFAAVQKSEVVDAIYQQTSRRLEERDLEVPDIKAVGTFECSVRLHPEVVGTFSVVIQKERQVQQGAKKK